jgi:hypothetical protein
MYNYKIMTLHVNILDIQCSILILLGKRERLAKDRRKLNYHVHDLDTSLETTMSGDIHAPAALPPAIEPSVSLV